VVLIAAVMDYHLCVAILVPYTEYNVLHL
jgi:hypothetical protein